MKWLLYNIKDFKLFSCLLKIIDPDQELDQVEHFQDIRTIIVARKFSEKKEYDIIQYTRKWARPTKCKDLHTIHKTNQTNNKYCS